MVNLDLAERRLQLLTDNIQLLRTAFRYGATAASFVINAIVVMPAACMRFGRCRQETAIFQSVGG